MSQKEAFGVEGEGQERQLHASMFATCTALNVLLVQG